MLEPGAVALPGGEDGDPRRCPGSRGGAAASRPARSRATASSGRHRRRPAEQAGSGGAQRCPGWPARSPRPAGTRRSSSRTTQPPSAVRSTSQPRPPWRAAAPARPGRRRRARVPGLRATAHSGSTPGPHDLRALGRRRRAAVRPPGRRRRGRRSAPGAAARRRRPARAHSRGGQQPRAPGRAATGAPVCRPSAQVPTRHPAGGARRGQRRRPRPARSGAQPVQHRAERGRSASRSRPSATDRLVGGGRRVAGEERSRRLTASDRTSAATRSAQLHEVLAAHDGVALARQQQQLAGRTAGLQRRGAPAPTRPPARWCRGRRARAAPARSPGPAPSSARARPAARRSATGIAVLGHRGRGHPRLGAGEEGAQVAHPGQRWHRRRTAPATG